MTDFIDDNEEQMDLGDGFLLEEDLLNSYYPGPRLFLINPVSGIGKQHLIGFLIEENEDSFLLGLPGFLVEGTSDGVREFSRFSDTPFFRMFKHVGSICMYPYGDFKKYYDEFLATKGAELYPAIKDLISDYLTDEGVSNGDGAPAPEPSEDGEKTMEETMRELQEQGKVVVFPFNNKQ